MGYIILDYPNQHQHICSPTVRSIISEFQDLKYIVGAAGILVAFLLDKELGPAEDDLPMRFKILLAAPVVVGVYYVQTLTPDQRQAELSYVFGFLIISILIYMSIWSLFGYKKTVSIPRPWWKPWGNPYRYPEKRVMGGRLRREVRDRIKADNIEVSEYFAGNEYKQDLVWTRKSRAILQVVLVLGYISVALFYTVTIALSVG